MPGFLCEIPDLTGKSYPSCLVCKRPVDSVELQTPVEVVHGWYGSAQSRHTGEVILIVRCHGEAFGWSNFRGELDPRGIKKL